MSAPNYSWIQTVDEDSLCIGVDTEIYSLEALFRVCYSFTDRCYLFLEKEDSASVVKVQIAKKNVNTNLTLMAAEFSNELINQKVRLDIAAETKTIRELIVTQAFTEANLLERNDTQADYLDDPRKIAI